MCDDAPTFFGAELASGSRRYAGRVTLTGQCSVLRIIRSAISIVVIRKLSALDSMLEQAQSCANRVERILMAKVPVFISFDYDHDATLKEFIVGQAKHSDSPFEIIDHSIKVSSQDWKERARTRIKRADQVIVICGKHTDTATGVNVEMRIAREEGTPYFLLAGYADGGNRKPAEALSSDKMYKWTWDNLKSLIAGNR